MMKWKHVTDVVFFFFFFFFFAGSSECLLWLKSSQKWQNGLILLSFSEYVQCALGDFQPRSSPGHASGYCDGMEIWGALMSSVEVNPMIYKEKIMKVELHHLGNGITYGAKPHAFKYVSTPHLEEFYTTTSHIVNICAHSAHSHENTRA